MVQNSFFSLRIQKWYTQNGRNLPWRSTKSVYFIWLSEVILQQTRVDQGLHYYLKFIEQFPTVVDLSNASEQEVLVAWQGLGYYSRARNLHKTAKIVVHECAGIFPNDYRGLLKLPGVGEYTAAAIASFAYSLPYAVVDGNVYRLLSRVFNIDLPIDTNEGKKHFAELARELLDKKNPATHNQAMMEMGALICTPKQAKCSVCPLNDICLSKQKNTISILPIKSKKVKIKQRYFHFLIAENKGKILLQKRTKKDIWQNMYQFPLIELNKNARLSEKNLPENFVLQTDCPIIKEKHVLTHQQIIAQFYRTSFDGESTSKNNLFWVKKKDLQNYPLPRLIERYLMKKE